MAYGLLSKSVHLVFFVGQTLVFGSTRAEKLALHVHAGVFLGVSIKSTERGGGSKPATQALSSH